MINIVEALLGATFEKEWLDTETSNEERIDLLAQRLKSKISDVDTSKESVEFFTQIFNDLGFSENSNPILAFINLLNEPITVDQLITIYNLLADDIISKDDLRGAGQNRKSHVIFNRTLYNNAADDIEFIVKTYDWLSSFSNIKNNTVRNNLPIDSEDYDIAAVRDRKASVIDLRDAIIFMFKEANGKVRNPDEIEKLLIRLEQVDNREKGSKGIYDKNYQQKTKTIDVNQYPQTDWSKRGNIDANRLSRGELKDYISYLATLL